MEKGINVAKSGIISDIHPSLLEEKQFTYLLNGNTENNDGNGVIVQNEHSNILCSKLEIGYQVVNVLTDYIGNRTFYFLANALTGCSEIGIVSDVNNFDDISADADSGCPGCNKKIILDIPLEDQEQVAHCVYNTLVTDCCGLINSKCLGFDIHHPIRAVLKREKGNQWLYFTDNNKDIRVMDLLNLDFYRYDKDNCPPETSVDVCLDCDKIKLFKDFTKPCLTAETIITGGNLQEGIYSFLLAYSDEYGNAVTRYFSTTNNVSIKNTNKFIYQQNELDSQTDLGIKLQLTHLDNRFDNYKLIVIVRSTVDAVVSYFKVGVFPITQNEVFFTSYKNDERVTVEDITKISPKYERAEYLAEANGYLFATGLQAMPPPNLQPIGNLMGAFVKWRTVIAQEGLYENGANCANYRGFRRDEPEPLSFRLFDTSGYITPLVPLVARPAVGDELDIVSDLDINKLSIEAYSDNKCLDDVRNREWQFFNTAALIAKTNPVQFVENCGDNSLPYTTAVFTQVLTCETDEVDYLTVPSEPFQLDSKDFNRGEQFTTLSAYLQNHYDDIMSLSIVAPLPNPLHAWLYGILINDGTSPTLPGCSDPESLFGSTCSAPTKVGDTVLVIVSEGKKSEVITYKTAADYKIDKIDLNCPIWKTKQASDGKSIPFSDDDMSLLMFGIVIQTPYVLKRVAVIGGNSIGSAMGLPVGNPLPASINIPEFSLDNFSPTTHCKVPADYAATPVKNALLLAQTYIPVGGTAFTYEFLNKIHANALWFSFTFGAVDDVIMEVTKGIPNSYPFTPLEFFGTPLNKYRDNKIRITVYDSLSSPNPIQISNVDVSYIFNAIDGINFQLSGTKNKTYYVALDSSVNTYDDGNGLGLLAFQDGTDICVTLAAKATDIDHTEITIEDIVFKKQETYSADCTYRIYEDLKCKPQVFQEGEFAYWESTIKYPCNKELYDSSELLIKPSDLASLDTNVVTKFEGYFTNGLDANGNYILNPETDFRDKPIRHFKFPDNCVAPFMDNDGISSQSAKRFIYPIGFYIDNDIIEAFLDIAVTNNLITQKFRDSIAGYEVFRGDKKLDQEIIASGLGYDMFEYDEFGKTNYFSNFPYNDLRPNNLLLDSTNNPLHLARLLDSSGTPTGAPKGAPGHLLTFHSPDTSFNKPTLPTEVKLDGYQRGVSSGWFAEQKKYPKMVVLSDTAYDAANAIAIIEITLEQVTSLSDRLISTINAFQIGAGVVVTTNIGGIVIAIAAIVAAAVEIALAYTFELQKRKFEWLKIFDEIGTPRNFASYYVGRGNYNKYIPNCYTEPTQRENQLRGLFKALYLNSDRYQLQDVAKEMYINNFSRESSVFLSTGIDDYAFDYGIEGTIDKSRVSASEANACVSIEIVENSYKNDAIPVGNLNILSPQLVIKTYRPDLFGQIDNIKWLHTGYCGYLLDEKGSKLTNKCDVIFGGDVFITPFSFKRKFPFFTTDANGLPSLTPFTLTEYTNIPRAKYYLDYKSKMSESYSFAEFPTIKSIYAMDCFTKSGLYVVPPSKYYLYYYGIPNFLVESEINCHYRYGENNREKNYPENVHDIIEWTQEDYVPIAFDNFYFYRNIFSSDETLYPYDILPYYYSKKAWDARFDHRDRLIYSLQDNNEQSLADRWQFFLANDYHDFGSKYGEVFGVTNIEDLKVLARFSNGFIVFNAYSTLPGTTQDYTVGNGGIFNTKPSIFFNSDIGYGGTQHNAILRTPYGTFWTDAKRGNIFHLVGGSSIDNIEKYGIRNWMRENLPLRILKAFPNLPKDVYDNPLNGIGLVLGWDNRYNRLFVTKKDAMVKDAFLGKITFDETDNNFYYSGVIGRPPVKVDITDERYFTDCSWTRSYSPLKKEWNSFFSFLPNYYIGLDNYFKSGITKGTKSGVWSHLLTNKSYQVFYGDLYPFKIEAVMKCKYLDKKTTAVQYILDSRRYINEIDWAENTSINFNELIAYNNKENSGRLLLKNRILNKLSQEYKYTPVGVEVFSTFDQYKYSVNLLYNLIRKNNTNINVWKNNSANSDKDIDDTLFNYRNTIQDMLRGEYLLTRFNQYKESRFKIMFQWTTSDEENSDY